MATGYDRWTFIAIGHGHWLTTGHGRLSWPEAMAMVVGYSQRLAGLGHWPWPLAMAIGPCFSR